jgi:hypothetical protein
MDKQNTSPATGQVAEGAVDQNPVTPDPTAAQSGSATQGVAATPAQASEDQKRIEALEKKYEQDIARIKSTFDKRDADQKKLLAQREEEFNKKLRELEVRGMDENTRKQYEEAHKQDEFQKIAQENTQLQQKLQENELIRNYQQFFVESGVPLSELTLDEGPEALAASGWQAIRLQKQQMEEELKRYKSGKPPEEKVLPEPPDTLNHNDKTASPMQLQDAIKKYAGGDEEKFYQLVEKGQLPTSVLKLKKE